MVSGLQSHEPIGSPVVGGGSRPGDGASAHGGEPFLYCNPCLGVPPMLVPSPLSFFAVQMAVGVIAMLVLVLSALSPVLTRMGDLP